MVKKFLVIALALAVVAPSVQANVAQQVQAAAEARLVEVMGQNLTVDEKVVLERVVQTALEDLLIPSAFIMSPKFVAIIATAIVAVIGTTYGILAFRSGGYNAFCSSFYRTKEVNKEIAEAVEAVKTQEQRDAEAKVEAEIFAKLSKEDKAIELAEKAVAKLKADKVKVEAKKVAEAKKEAVLVLV